MTRPLVLVLATTFLVAGLCLPPATLAEALAGPSAERLAEVVRGAWILKGMLVLNALVLAAVARRHPDGARFEPLLARGLQESGPRGASDGWSAKWSIGGLACLALALRLRALEVGPWFDEIDTWVHYARRPLGEIVTTFDSQNQHLLYSVLARLSILAVGDGVFALRLPAAILGVLCIPALWSFGRLITGRREALFAAALLCVSYHHVWFSQNARGYTGLLLFTLLGSAAFVRMLGAREPERLGAPLSYGLWMSLAAATHATAILAIAAHGLVWLALACTRRSVGPNRWMPGLGFVFAVTFALLLHALVLPQFVETLLAPTMPGVATEWKNPLWLLTETVAGLTRGLPGGIVLVIAGATVGLLGVFDYLRQSAVVLAILLLGTLITAGAMIATGHNLWPRLFFFSAGFYVLIAIRGFAGWVALTARAGLEPMRGGILTGLLTLVCLTSAATLPTAWLPKQDYRGALEHVEASRSPADAVVTLDMTTMPYQELYTAGWGNVDNVGDITALETHYPRTWVVHSTETRLRAEHPELWDRLQAEYRVSETFWGTVGGGEIVVRVREN